MYISIIPARGGSKGIPLKNIARLAGHPLIYYTIKASVNSKYISSTYLSTDCESIINVAVSYGISRIIRRPHHLASDTTSMIEVLQHALQQIDITHTDISGIVLLQPTSPLRSHSHIDSAIEIFSSSKAGSLVSVVEVPHAYIPESLYHINDDPTDCQRLISLGSNQSSRRQDKPKFYARNGPSIVITTPSLIKAGKLYSEKPVPFVMSGPDSTDIDTLSDLRFAEFLMSELGT